MFSKSKNVFNSSNAYTDAALNNGGLRTSTSGVILNTSADSVTQTTSGYTFKKLKLDGSSGGLFDLWNSSDDVPLNRDIVLQVIATTTTDTTSSFSSGQKLTLFYAFTTEDLISTDNEANRLSARKQILPMARILPCALPVVAVNSSELRIYTTDRVTVRGPYMYAWIEHQDLQFDSGEGSIFTQLNIVS